MILVPEQAPKLFVDENPQPLSSRPCVPLTLLAELVERGRDDLARVDQVSNQALVDVQIAFVLAAIAEVMAPGEHSPDLRADSKRVRKDLKYDVSVRGTITRAAERREGQRVRGIVGEIEPAFE